MAGQPEPVVRLEMVARRRLAVPRRAAGHELRSATWAIAGSVAATAATARNRAGYKDCAAARSSSKSGTASFS